MIAALLFASAAWATNFNVDVCADLDVDFVDADPSVGDDYITSSSSLPARGVHIQVLKYSSTLPRVLLGTVADYWALSSGALAGCVPYTLVLSSGNSYRTRVISEAYVNGETIEVYTDTTNTTLTSYYSAFYTPSSNTTWTTTTTGDYDIWNIVAAGGYAVWRSNLGNSSGTILAAPDASSTKYESSTGYVKIGSWTGDAGHQHKYVIAHEFTHALMHQRYASSGADDSAAYGACPGHSPASTDAHWFVSKEYQGEAFWEGMAQYNAAATFNNNTTQTDCSYNSYKDYDFDQDGTNEPDQPIDCAGSPTIEESGGGSFSITGMDYLGTYCDATFLSCPLTHNCNRGTEFDWLQFLWYLDANESMAPDDFADIYVDARNNGGGYASSGYGHGSGFPSYELYHAAVRLNSSTWGSAWGTWYDDYGLDR